MCEDVAAKPRPGWTSLSMTPKAIRLHHRNLPLLLLQARERVLAHFRPILHANGVTEQQWRIVRALYEQSSLEPREIVELCRISSPSMAGVLARMEELGLVLRRRLPHDQRRVQVSLTPRARSMASRMAPQIEATYRRIEQNIGAEFSARFQQALDQLLATLEAHAPARIAAAAPIAGVRRRRRRAGGRRARGAVQQQLSQGRSYEQA
jgi:homoprotocatechuate degradation regulator HpaR